MSAYKAELAVVTMAASSLVEPECNRVVRAAGDVPSPAKALLPVGWV